MDREAIQERFGIVGESAAIKHVIDRVRQVAPTELTVTVQGESGVGKELAARAIHDLSPRRHEPMVVVNCGAIPEGLIESELFGNVKGAYTGAVERRTGHFEEADGGTLFLDEIGEMPQQAQVRLLRVLESGEVQRRIRPRDQHRAQLRRRMVEEEPDRRVDPRADRPALGVAEPFHVRRDRLPPLRIHAPPRFTPA